MKIVWDEPKRLATLVLRDLDFSLITSEFFDGAKITAARDNRFRALGVIDDQAYVVIFSLLGTEAISIVSCRRANAKERRSL